MAACPVIEVGGSAAGLFNAHTLFFYFLAGRDASIIDSIQRGELQTAKPASYIQASFFSLQMHACIAENLHFLVHYSEQHSMSFFWLLLQTTFQPHQAVRSGQLCRARVDKPCHRGCVSNAMCPAFHRFHSIKHPGVFIRRDMPSQQPALMRRIPHPGVEGFWKISPG